MIYTPTYHFDIEAALFAMYMYTVLNTFPLYFKFQVNQFHSFQAMLQTKFNYKIKQREIIQQLDQAELLLLAIALLVVIS